jgi:hypothetical protein
MAHGFFTQLFCCFFSIPPQMNDFHEKLLRKDLLSILVSFNRFQKFVTFSDCTFWKYLLL